MTAYWNPHLKSSKNAQQRWASGCSGQEVAILGAGRLLDVAVDPLSQSFKRLWLIDADPLSVPSWRSSTAPVRWDLADLSGVLKLWTKTIEATTGSWETFLKTIEALPRPKAAYFPVQADGVVSLNLLTQIPVVRQDILEEILLARFGKTFVQTREPQWLRAFSNGARWLVEQHLEFWAKSRAENILIISDLEYLSYGLDPFPQHGAPTSGRWDGEWHAEQGIRYTLDPALFGLDLDKQLPPAYSLAWKESWLWHIAPLGLENKLHGTVHRVGCLAWIRK